MPCRVRRSVSTEPTVTARFKLRLSDSRATKVHGMDHFPFGVSFEPGIGISYTQVVVLVIAHAQLRIEDEFGAQSRVWKNDVHGKLQDKRKRIGLGKPIFLERLV